MSANARDPESPESTRAGDDATARTHALRIDCHAAARWLWDHVDTRLPADSHAAMERHLTVCASCAAFIAFARAMRRALADLRGNYRQGIALPLTSPPAHSRSPHDPRLE